MPAFAGKPSPPLGTISITSPSNLCTCARTRQIRGMPRGRFSISLRGFPKTSKDAKRFPMCAKSLPRELLSLWTLVISYQEPPRTQFITVLNWWGCSLLLHIRWAKNITMKPDTISGEHSTYSFNELICMHAK